VSRVFVVGEFLAAMSHEIRTPLQAIIGYADLLEQKTSGEDVAIVKTIKSSGNILVQVINDILSYSKYKSKDFKLQATPFSIRECIEEAMDVSAGLATDESTPYILLTPFNKNSRGVTSLEALLDMVYELEPDVPYRVEADHRLVMQILVNLLFNALKFTDKGFVRVVVGTTEESGLRISVSDTGPGKVSLIRLNSH
jgi:signal transduction histidine kinase